MKRRICSVLALSIILPIVAATPVFAAKNSFDNFIKSRKYENQFADVNSAEWYANSVSTAYEYGLVSGDSETSYNPMGEVTIAETIVIACRLNNIYCENNYTFDGDGEKEWYQPYVDYAMNHSIIDKEYVDYNAPANRMEFATILSKALPKEEFEQINNITEIPDVANEESDVYMLYNAGIIRGNDEYGTFHPTTNITRSEVAAIVVRIADKTQRNTFKLEKKPVEVELIVLNNSAISMAVGDTETIKAAVVPDNATDKTVLYSSSNASVAAVSSNGEIKALSPGNATIAATSSNGKTALCSVSVAAAPIEFSGRGDKVINNVNIPFGSYYAELTHNGERNFISKLYYGEKSYDYFSLSNEIGKCSLQVALFNNGNAAINNGMLEVEADGDWTIKIKPVTGTTTTNVKGSGQVVTGIFRAKFSRVAVNLSHSGDRNFIAKVIKYNGTKSYDYESLANEIGDYSGQKVVQLIPGVQYYFYVIADGNWTIDFGEGDKVTTYSASNISTSNNSQKNYDDDDYGEYDNSHDSGDKKFSYTDATNFNTYAAAATKACNNAAADALSAYKTPAMASVYIGRALNYASTAKSNMKNAIKILESRVDLTYTDGSTVLEKAQEALDAINAILDFDTENGDSFKLQGLCTTAAVKSLVVQKASVELVGAFLE